MNEMYSALSYAAKFWVSNKQVDMTKSWGESGGELPKFLVEAEDENPMEFILGPQGNIDLLMDKDIPRLVKVGMSLRGMKRGTSFPDAAETINSFLDPDGKEKEPFFIPHPDLEVEFQEHWNGGDDLNVKFCADRMKVKGAGKQSGKGLAGAQVSFEARLSRFAEFGAGDRDEWKYMWRGLFSPGKEDWAAWADAHECLEALEAKGSLGSLTQTQRGAYKIAMWQMTIANAEMCVGGGQECKNSASVLPKAFIDDDYSPNVELSESSACSPSRVPNMRSLKFYTGKTVNELNEDIKDIPECNKGAPRTEQNNDEYGPHQVYNDKITLETTNGAEDMVNSEDRSKIDYDVPVEYHPSKMLFPKCPPGLSSVPANDPWIVMEIRDNDAIWTSHVKDYLDDLENKKGDPTEYDRNSQEEARMSQLKKETLCLMKWAGKAGKPVKKKSKERSCEEDQGLAWLKQCVIEAHREWSSKSGFGRRPWGHEV